MTKTFHKNFGNISYYKFSSMRYFKIFIYFLNKDSYAKRIALYFLSLNYLKPSKVLPLGGESEGLGGFLFISGWESLKDYHYYRCLFPLLTVGEPKELSIQKNQLDSLKGITIEF